MIAARLKNIFFMLLASQIACVSVSVVFWCFVILRDERDDPVGAHGTIATLFILAAAFFISVVSFLVFFYRRMVRFSRMRRSVTYGGLISTFGVLLAVTVISLPVTLLTSEIRAVEFTAAFAGTAMLLYAFLHAVGGRILRKIYNHPRNRLNVLVLGMNNRTLEFCQIIKNTKHIGAEVHGYLDVREFPDAPVPYLGALGDLDAVLRNQVIDMVSIFLPVRSFYDAIDKIIETCGFYGVTSFIVGNVFEATSIRRVPTSISDFGSMAYSSTTVDYVGLAVKRAFDVIASAAGLIVLSPVMLCVAAYIKLSSKGPVFFTQERIGFNKRPFKMLKFRTMVPDAEARQKELEAMNEMDGAVFKITNDPRLIPGGAFLRRHSLDELPQIWNVLKGDMSVVGPRPLSRRDYDLLKDDWQRKRFSMRPGLTCTWQVSEKRNDVTFMEWMKLDLDYIAGWRLGYDFELIFRTFRVLFFGGGK